MAHFKTPQHKFRHREIFIDAHHQLRIIVQLWKESD